MKDLAVALVAISALALGCGSSHTTPTSPTMQTTPTPPSGGQSLSGFVRDRNTSLPLNGARVDGVNPGTGALTGNFAVTDASGRYTLTGISGLLHFRASKDGYAGEPRQVFPAQTPTADFALMPLSSLPARERIAPGEMKTSSVTTSDGACGSMILILPCKRMILIVSQEAKLHVRLAWSSADDIDLELWQNDRIIAASYTCQSCGEGPNQEQITVTIPAGQYELRAPLYAGSGGTFTLNVERVS